MAQRVVLTDDLDGSEATQTLNYTVDGQEYEIDLSEKNAQRLREFLQEFIGKARPVERPPVLTLAPARSGRRQSFGGSGWDDIAQIRAWAESQGMEVSARGRVKEIIEAYDAAHS